MFSIRAVTVAMMLLRPLLFPLSWLQNGHVMSMQPVPWPDPDPVVAAAIGAMYGSRKTGAAAGGDRPGPAGRVAT